jgi:tRNA(fMet)-specific endonuclease VapC
MAIQFLLDTNVLSETMRPDPDPELLRRVLEVGSAAATAAPVWHELTYGYERLPRGKRRRAIEALIADLGRALVVLPYDAAAARWHARERARLVKGGKTPAFVDGQIASVAVLHGLTLVTRNVRDYVSFRHLTVESWFSRTR